MATTDNKIKSLQTQEFFANHAYNVFLTGGTSASPTASQSMQNDAAMVKFKKLGYECVEALAPSSNIAGLFLYVAYSKENKQSVQVFCRGTNLDDASVVVDLDPYGPGYSIMVKNRAIIMEGLTKALNESKSDTLNISGHSLGGAISKLLCLYLNKIHNKETTCITFACPPISNDLFELMFNKYVKNNYNFLHEDDYIINIPMALRPCQIKKKYIIKNNKSQNKFKSFFVNLFNILTCNLKPHSLITIFNYLSQNNIINNYKSYFEH